MGRGIYAKLDIYSKAEAKDAFHVNKLESAKRSLEQNAVEAREWFKTLSPNEQISVYELGGEGSQGYFPFETLGKKDRDNWGSYSRKEKAQKLLEGNKNIGECSPKDSHYSLLILLKDVGLCQSVP